MNNNPQPYEPHTYFGLALDPIHVGTGGYRLGRVDMTIVREPGTNLPKIPGTSLSGACRAYAAMQENGKYPNCAGQGQEDKSRNLTGHCCDPACPVCVTFGFSKGDKSFHGLAQISDARLVLFPVHSLAGPVWVTCQDALCDWQANVGNDPNDPDEGKVRVASGVKGNDRLNLGWLMLEKEKQSFSLDGQLADVPNEIIQRAVLVSNKLFSQIVNDNLEVRTSVSIDPATGAAADGALFSYEALPRTSVLAFEVIISNPNYYRIGNQALAIDMAARVEGTVKSGLQLLEWLGVGGMNTRGMGRLRILGLGQSNAAEKKQ